MGLEIPNPHRQIVRLSEILGSQAYARRAFAARARAGQGHRRQPGGRRSREDAPPAGGGHHRLGQVGGDQRDDPVAALQVRAAQRAADHDRSEDARALGLPGHPAPARAGRDRHEAGGERARLVRRRDGAALQADELSSACATSPATTTRSSKAKSRSSTRSPSTRGNPQTLTAAAEHRGGDRRAGRPDDGGRQEGGGADRAPRAEGARLRHPPHPRHAAPVGGRHHRPHQGQHPDAHRLPGVVQGRLAHHPRPVGRRGAARLGRHALPAAGHRPAAARARRLRRRPRGACAWSRT